MNPLIVGLLVGLYLVVGYYGFIYWIEKSLRGDVEAEVEKYPVLFPVFIAVLTLIWAPIMLCILSSSLKEYVQKKSANRDDRT